MCKFTAEKFIEDDGSVTLSLDQIDLVENGKDEKTAIKQLAQYIYEYAEEYYADFELFYNAPNRRGHLPYVLDVLSVKDISEIESSIECRDGETEDIDLPHGVVV